jgi:hypothetical protein
MNVYDLQHGWSTYPQEACEDITFESRVEWYWGDPDTSAVEVVLAESLITPVFAKVTVWFRGTGVVHHMADAPSLAAYVAQVLPGVKALAVQEYRVIE